MKFIWEEKDIRSGRKYWDKNHSEAYILAYYGSEAEIYGIALLDGNTLKLGNRSEAARKLTEWESIPFALDKVPEKALAELQKSWDEVNSE